MPDSSGTRPWRRAAPLMLMLAWLVAPISMAHAQSSSPQFVEASPIPSGVSASLPPFPIAPGTSAAPGELPWQGVVAPFQATGRAMSHLTIWRAGFAALEAVEESERMVALWHSTDGTSWRRDPLPTGLRRNVWALLPFRDQLVLVRGTTPRDRETIRHELWATRDGRRWHRLGAFQTNLDVRLRPDWQLGLSAIEATRDRLVLFADIDPCCGSGGWHPGPLIATIDGIAAAQQPPYGGLLVWTSPDGDRWTRHRAPGFAGSDGHAYLDQLAPDGAGGLLATRLGQEAAVLKSPDGIHWTVVAPLPDRYEEGGSQGLIVPTGGLMVFGDAGDGDGFGNLLGAWSLDLGGAWLRVINQQPAFTQTQAAAGDTVIVVGSSWDHSDRRWPWILVSLDGGRTWDAALSWSGMDGGCLGDIVVRERTAVLVGCQEGQPAMWSTQLPGSAPGPSTEPGVATPRPPS